MKRIQGYSKRFSIALLLLIVSLLALPVAPIYAIADPDTPPQVSAVYVYEFSNGSIGVLIDYYLDYAALPTETATEAYLAVFVDIDGTTQLKAVAPYTFVDSGYGRGLVWIPFTSAEATAYGLDSALIASYRIWLTGNPTLAWAGDPPKTITTIDQWVTTSVPETLASRILYYADVLELAWSLDVVEATADGNKLTSVGSSYFENVISGCRTLAPGAFSDTTSDPNYMAISYDTAFGATATSGTATVAGSPQTLTEGTDSVNVTSTGTITIDLAQWTSGNVTDANSSIASLLIGDDAAYATYGVYWRAQSFTTVDATTVTSFTVKGYRSGNPGNITGSLRATVANVPSGADLGGITGTYNGNTLTTDTAGEWFTITLSSPVALTATTTYAIVLRATTGGAANALNIMVDTGNGYAGGQYAGSVNSGGAWTGVAATDMVFDILHTGTMTGSPVTLYPGVNTLIVTGAGTFATELEVIDTAVIYERSVEGTGFDLTTLAAAFGMSRWMLSSLVWMFISIIACAAAYAGASRASLGDTSGASKVVMILLAILMIGGMLLGLLHPLVVSFMLIVYGAFIGYILFFRSDSLHKGFMFMIWMFVIVSIAGNIAASGQSGITVTRLTASITANETDSIPVASTIGFPDAGIILIGDEQITYPDRDATHFLDTTFNDIRRGGAGTEASAHAVNASVRTKESYLLNASIDYKIARITDSAGALAFIAMPILLLDLVLTFFKLPLEFLGTDLAILTYLWMVVAIGMIVGFVVSLVGGRRV